MLKIQYRNYLLGLLTVVAAFNSFDRGVLGLSMESIKQEFELSDGQLGLMSGLAFSFFYAVAGIPIARWADTGNRNHVVALTTGLWSVMLVVSGVVGNFTQLLLARVGVAVGESGCIPPAQSLISDYFNRAERPRAMAIYWMSGPLSIVLAYLVGGWLVDEFGWRITFMVIGVPSVLLAILVKFTLREPRLEKVASKSLVGELKVDSKSEVVSLKIVIITLWKTSAFRHVVMGFCISFFFGAGIGVWLPAFFMRSFDMGAAELGVLFSLTWGVVGIVFTFVGGYLAARYVPKKEGLQMKCISIILIFSAVFHGLCYFSNNKYMSLLYISMVLGVLMPLAQASVYSAIQSLVEERMRAVAIAFIFMLANLIGLGLGPIAVGLLSDSLSSYFEQESLRYALLLFSPGYFWCAFHYWRASNSIEEEIRLVEEKTDSISELNVIHESDALSQAVQ